MPHPAQYAVQLLSRFEPLLHLLCHILHMSNCRFQSRAKAHGVAHAPVQLVHGDFLKNSDVSNAISSAGLVFANNPRFGPKLNMEILCTLVPLMQKGCKLVCFDDCGLDQWDALKFVKMIHVPRGAIIDSLC